MRYRVISDNGVVYDAISTIDADTFNKYRNSVNKVHGNKFTKTLYTINYALFKTIVLEYKRKTNPDYTL